VCVCGGGGGGDGWDMVGFSTTKYNQVFTARLHYSPVIPAHVTLCAVTDSGRYFVLKITNAQGKHAFIGM
jgi:hypothetical protein